MKNQHRLIKSLYLAICLTIAACSGLNNSATNTKTAEEFAVTVTDKGCEPGELVVPAGKSTFVITNKSSRPLEWEILDGVKVVEEKENIAPGFIQKLKADLIKPEYGMACGLRSNPKGKITVKAKTTS